MSVLQRFFKDTLIYGLAIVLPRLINFLLVPLYTTVFENESYSDNTTFYVYAAFFNVLLTYGLETSFFRFFSKYKKKEEVFSTALAMILGSTFLFGILVYTFSSTIANFIHFPLSFFKLLMAITIVETLIVIPFAYLRVTGRPIKFAVIKLVNVLIIVGLNVLFLSDKFGLKSLQNTFQVHQKVEYIFIANLIASICVLLLVSPYFFKSKLKINTQILKDLLNYGWPIMVAGIAFVINENLDKWLLPILADKNINGAYSACYKLAVFMTLFIQAFRMGAEPFFFNHSDNANAKQTYATILKYFTIIGSFGLLVITVFLPIIKFIFIGNESYLIALNIVPIVLLANLCLGIYHNLSIWYKLTGKTKYGMYISIIGAFITITFNWVMIPKIGFMAAAYATLLAYGSMMFISYFLGKKHYYVPYNTKRIGLYIVLATVFSYLNYYQFNSNLIFGAAFIIIFTTIAILLEKNEIKQLLKK